MLDEKGGRVYAEGFCTDARGSVGTHAVIVVSDANAYNSAIVVSILDKLLDRGYITVEEYLERISKLNIGLNSDLIGGNDND